MRLRGEKRNVEGKGGSVPGKGTANAKALNVRRIWGCSKKGGKLGRWETVRGGERRNVYKLRNHYRHCSSSYFLSDVVASTITKPQQIGRAHV